MSISSIINGYMRNNCGNGHFLFKNNDQLSKKNNFPDDYGIYIIYDNTKYSNPNSPNVCDSLLYIGKAGTLYNDYIKNGPYNKAPYTNNCTFRFSTQTLRGRIANKYGNNVTISSRFYSYLSKKQFYKIMMIRDNIAELRFEYFITYSKNGHCKFRAPSMAEAELINEYLLGSGCLPPWNKSF